MKFSIIEMEDWNLLQKNNRCITVFLTVLLVCCVLLESGAPAAAAPSVDTSVASFSSFYYYTGQNSYSMTDASTSNEIKIPLYCMYFGSDSPDESYLNGYIRTSLPGYSFSFNGSSIAPSYFEVNSAPGLSCSSPTANSNSMTIYFDNHLKQNNFYFILGYYVFNFSEYTTLSITVTPGAGLVQRDPSVITLYSSTSEFGLAQAIVTAINSASDIDIILNGLQEISENTDLLNQVISGLSDNTTLLTQIYQRLGQMQTADNQFYSDIDNIIDSISWNKLTGQFIGVSDTINGTYESSFSSDFLKKGYYQVYPSNISNNLILCFDVGIYCTANYIFKPDDIKIYFGADSRYYEVDFIYFKSDYFYRFYCTVPYYSRYNLLSRTLRIECTIPDEYAGYLRYYPNYNKFNGYILDTDIEYWTLYNNIITTKLYDLLESYIYANVSSPVEQAATQAAGLAQNQLAAEQSLAALSPGRMEDLDAADAFDILDETANSTRFWTMLVNEFSISSGVLWGVFIFALMIGLIAFILRLR